MPTKSVAACLFLTLAIPASLAMADIDRQDAIAREMNCIRQHMDQSSGLTWQDVCYTAPATNNEYNNKNLDMVAQEHDAYYKDYKPAINEGSDTQYTMPQDQYDAYEATGEALPAKTVGPLSQNTVSPTPTYATNPNVREYYSGARPADFGQPKTHTFEVGQDSYFYTYEEPGVMEQEGPMFGLYSLYTYRPQAGDAFNSPAVDVFKVDTRFAIGEVDYTSNGTGTVDNEDNYMFEVRGTVGKDYYYGPTARTTPYFGFGYRHLNNDSAGMRSTTGHWGYERRSQYIYIPIGVDVAFLPRGTWQAHANFEYDFFVRGWQDSYLTDVPRTPPYEDIQNEQEDGYGARASVKFVKETTGVNYIVEPFIRYWNIDDSEVVVSQGTGWIEPKNETVEAGVKLGVQF